MTRKIFDEDTCREDEAWWYGGEFGSRYDRVIERDPEDDNHYEPNIK